MLIIALGELRFQFICRRLRISEEKLRLKLRKMHSLLQISDSSITTYHRSLHDFFLDKERAGIYHIHPTRVALVRLPETRHRFAIRFVKLLLAILCYGLYMKSMDDFFGHHTFTLRFIRVDVTLGSLIHALYILSHEIGTKVRMGQSNWGSLG